MLIVALTNSARVPHTPGQHTWWYVGLAIGFLIVVVVVIVAALILTFAGRIGAQAREGIDLMDRARASTLPVWELQRTNTLLTTMWRASESVRETLGQAVQGDAHRGRSQHPSGRPGR